jgi:hypothetical protein
MKLSNLDAYVQNRNAFKTLIGQPTYDIANLTQDDCQELMDNLDGACSPENMSCDGEISGAVLRNKAAFLFGAVRELESYALSNSFKLTRNFSEY